MFNKLIKISEHSYLDIICFFSNFILNKIKNIYYILKYIPHGNKRKISKGIKFNQKTILSGKGTIILKKNVSLGYKIGGYFHSNVTEIQARYPNSFVILEDNVSFNNSNLIIAANKIHIKRDCRIGANVTIMDFEAHDTNPKNRSNLGVVGEVIINENVWIGNNVIILKNVYIGKNSIIAAGSVVLKGEYPDNCILGGNPAKVIKFL